MMILKTVAAKYWCKFGHTHLMKALQAINKFHTYSNMYDKQLLLLHHVMYHFFCNTSIRTLLNNTHITSHTEKAIHLVSINFSTALVRLQQIKMMTIPKRQTTHVSFQNLICTNIKRIGMRLGIMTVTLLGVEKAFTGIPS